MAQPFEGAAEGAAHIDVHANTHPYEEELPRGVERATDDVDKDLKKTGDKWGETSAKSMGDRLEAEGPKIAERFTKVLGRQKVTQKVTVELDKDNKVVRRWVTTTTKQIEDAFEEAGGPGGPLNKVGKGISDAIGAGFNVSGQSPLIGALVPVVGAIIGLVIAAIQSVGALVTLLASLPVLLGSIGADAAVFILAFQGLGTAIQGAFAAKNAKELKKALEDLTPAARSFVRELLPLRQLVDAIQNTVQQNFFSQIAGDITAVAKALGPEIQQGLGGLATTIGGLLHELAGFLQSPLFRDFIEDILGTTQVFLEKFGPDIGKFFKGIIELAIAATPLLDDFGKQFGTFLAQAGAFFDKVANDPAFQKFLEDMGDTFFQILRVINSASGFLTSFVGMLNQVGGNDVISTIADAFDQLAFFFQTPLGQEGLQGFVDMAIAGIKAVTGLIELFFILIAVARNVFPAIGAMFDKIGGDILDGVHKIGQFFTDLWHKAEEVGRGFVSWVQSIPHTVGEAFKDAKNFLLTAGRNIIEGLIQGVRDKLGPLDNIFSFIAQKIRNFFPFSPAKEGPLSGQGDPRIAGAKIVQRLGEGMHMEVPSLRANRENVANNITFRAGDIQQNFQGLSTVTQARGIGQGVAGGILNGLIDRDTRLAVRTL